jgi:hypothetical protein
MIIGRDARTPSSIACSGMLVGPNRGSVLLVRIHQGSRSKGYTWLVSWALAKGKALGLGVDIVFVLFVAVFLVRLSGLTGRIPGLLVCMRDGVRVVE